MICCVGGRRGEERGVSAETEGKEGRKNRRFICHRHFVSSVRYPSHVMRPWQPSLSLASKTVSMARKSCRCWLIPNTARRTHTVR